MLVCSISMRPPRSAIAATIVEAGAADDTLGTGNVVFATLVDDPASVAETVDAYLGEIMLEAASADVVLDANIPATYAAAITEAATAIDTQSATAGVVTATWDASTVTAVTLSGGNLVATNTGTTSADQGAHVAAASGKTTGKYYFEMSFTVAVINQGDNVTFGIGTTAATYTNMGNSGTGGVVVYRNNGNILTNGSFGGISLGSINAGQIVGCAVDLDNRKIWFKELSAGSWNGSGTANPATNTGGVTILAGTMIPFCTFGGALGTSGKVTTANFGATAFVGAVPSGFTAGWPS